MKNINSYYGQQIFSLHEGRMLDTFVNLINKSSRPLTMAGFMRQRIDSMKMPLEERAVWFEKAYACVDMIAYHPDGKMKLIYDASSLVTNHSELGLTPNGFLKLTGPNYKLMEGFEFTKKDYTYCGQDFHRGFTEKQAKKNPVLLAMARDDKNLLKEYTEIVAEEASNRSSDAKHIMDLYLKHSYHNVDPKKENIIATFLMLGWLPTSMVNGAVAINKESSPFVTIGNASGTSAYHSFKDKAGIYYLGN